MARAAAAPLATAAARSNLCNHEGLKRREELSSILRLNDCMIEYANISNHATRAIL